jgi:PAS domain S-box-containing protein
VVSDRKDDGTLNPTQSPLKDATTILDTIQEAYLRLDGELRFTFINRAAEILLGAPRADLIGKTPWDVHPESAGTPLERGFRRAKAENAVVSFENYYDPWKRWYSITAMPDSSGGFVVHFSDITERRAAEARLQAQNERFQRIIENTDAGYFRIGTNGCYEDVNPAWLRMHGFANREEAIGLHFSAVQVPEDVAEAQEIVETLMRGEARRGELSTLRQDGTIGYQTFSANPVLDGDRVVGLEGFLVDITAWKTAEEEKRRTLQRANEAVAKAEAYYRLMFNSVSDAVFVHKFGEDGRPSCFLEVNDNACRLLGYTREELLQMRVVDIIALEEHYSGPRISDQAIS